MFRSLAMRAWMFCLLAVPSGVAWGQDLDSILEAGVLRHLGVPYANFVTGSGDGLDVELVQGFAEHLGVDYEFVATDWENAFGDLTGRHAERDGDVAALLKHTPIRGDILANGVTILPWRTYVVDFSTPTFPSGIWLMARADSPLHPIRPAGVLSKDLEQVRQLIGGVSVLALENTCLDPGLYRLDETGAHVRLANRTVQLNEMAPAILNREAETTLLDVPDALIALNKWPGSLKVIGPISQKQQMAAAFRKTSPKLLAAFNRYFEQIWRDGSYVRLVQRYYPEVFDHYREFFEATTF